MYSPYEAYLTFNRCFGVYDMECVLFTSPIKGTFIVFSIHSVKLISILSIKMSPPAPQSIGRPEDRGLCTHIILLSFPHHDHHPCLAASSISFLGGIGIALFRLIVALTSLRHRKRERLG
jgi:hypothetical protein